MDYQTHQRSERRDRPFPPFPSGAFRLVSDRPENSYRRSVMAIVIVNEVEGGDQDFYESVNSKVMPGGEMPAGCQVHIAGPTENGWRVITVWDSDEDFQQ